MKFGENVRKLRMERGWTIQELVEKTGFSKRTIINWEQGDKLPRRQDTYTKLAEIFGVPVQEVASQEDLFVASASEQYGSRGMKQAMDMVKDFGGLFAGGELSDEDKLAVFNALQEAYFIAKVENKKYAPRKYRKGVNSTD